MATHGEQAAARVVERLEGLETEFERLVDTVKSEYHDWWETMTGEEMDEFIALLGLQDQKALRQFIITRGEDRRTKFFPQWMLED